MRTSLGRVGIAVCVVLLTAGACGTDDDPGTDSTPTATADSTPVPTASDSPEKPTGVQVDITIADGKLTPQGKRVEVMVGEPVTLHVTSDEADEIHVHSDPEHSLEVAAGETKDLTFTIDTPGQVAVESHHLDATAVQLVVRP